MRFRVFGPAVAIAIMLADRPAMGAEGFGATTPGGSGGTVVRVANLNDSGPGSLREAVAGGNRTVVFDVAGTIALSNDITIRSSFVTVDGLSAPSPGITLRGAGLIIRGPAHDMVIRGLRIRDAWRDGIWVTDAAFNVLIEHVSVHNSADGNIDITRDGTRDVTVAWSILAEPAGEEKNMLIAFLPTRVSLHHNLFTAAQQRNPQVTFDDSAARSRDTETTLDMRNNLVWNWRGGYGARIRYGARANVVNNYFAAAGGDARDALIVCRGLAADSQCYDDPTNVARTFVDGNVSADGVDVDDEGTETLPFPSAAIVTADASRAACDVHAGAGVRPLDALDASYLAAVKLSCGGSSPPANRAPIAKAGSNRTAALGEAVAFDGSSSHDPDGQALTYTWSFGDGSPTARGVKVQHAYRAPGAYAVRLTVSDGALSAVATITVVVVSPGPGAGGTFVDGFDRDVLGSEWMVVRGHAGAQGGQLETGAVAGDNVVVVPALRGSTQQVSAEFFSPDNNAAPRLGIALRVKDAQNYYAMYRLAGGASVLRISRVIGGEETVLGQVNVKNPARNAGFWLSARADDRFLTLELDGVSRLTVSDDDATLAEGTVGLLLRSRFRLPLQADNFSAVVD